MKKTVRTRIAAAAMTLLMVTSLSVVAFADGPQGGPQMGGMQPGSMQMGQSMGGNRPTGGQQISSSEFTGNMQSSQNGPMGNQQAAPGFGSNEQQGSMNEMPNAPQGNSSSDRQQDTPRFDSVDGRQDPMNGQQPPEAPNGQEPPEKPGGDGNRTPPANAPMNGQPAQENGEEPLEKPESDDLFSQQNLPEDEQSMFRLFQQFLDWLKGNSEK